MTRMKPIQVTKVSTMHNRQYAVRMKCLLSFVKNAILKRSKLVMPIISLQIPVSELLETIRHLLVSGKDVREELYNAAMRANDCKPAHNSSQNLPNAQ